MDQYVNISTFKCAGGEGGAASSPPKVKCASGSFSGERASPDSCSNRSTRWNFHRIMPLPSLYSILEMFTVFSVLVDSSPIRPPLVPIVAFGGNKESDPDAKAFHAFFTPFNTFASELY